MAEENLSIWWFLLTSSHKLPFEFLDYYFFEGKIIFIQSEWSSSSATFRSMICIGQFPNHARAGWTISNQIRKSFHQFVSSWCARNVSVPVNLRWSSEQDHDSFDIGEKKLKRVVCPEVYADPTKPKQRVLNENKLLTSRRQGSVRSVAAPTPSATTRNRTSSTSKSAGKDDFNPYARKCKICTGGISLQGAYYCQDCAYSKGKWVDQEIFLLRVHWSGNGSKVSVACVERRYLIPLPTNRAPSKCNSMRSFCPICNILQESEVKNKFCLHEKTIRTLNLLLFSFFFLFQEKQMFWVLLPEQTFFLSPRDGGHVYISTPQRSWRRKTFPLSLLELIESDRRMISSMRSLVDHALPMRLA